MWRHLNLDKKHALANHDAVWERKCHDYGGSFAPFPILAILNCNQRYNNFLCVFLANHDKKGGKEGNER